jgi:ABC transport system ATP-binding/permease protein
MAAAPILALQQIQLTIGSTRLLEDAELSVLPGEKVALVGRNGSGKSTLLKIAAGEIEAEGGRRFLQPGATIRYLPQEPDLSGYPTTLAYVEAGMNAGDEHYRATYLLNSLGLDGTEDPTRLSGGEARRAALARVLAPEPDIILLDEPTNHLDLPAIEWLETELTNIRSALVIISHDRRFLADLTRATVWLDRGVTRRLNKGFSGFEEWRDQVLEEEETARHKLDRQIVREEHWLTYGVTARRKRNVRRLDGLFNLRQERRDLKRAVGDVKISVSEGDTSGRLVAEAENVTKAYDKPIVTDLTMRVIRGDRLGIIGANGAGKTTLIKLLTGEIAPDSGRIRLGSNLQLASLDQRRASLDPDTTLKQAITGGGSDTLVINGTPKHFMGYLKDFLFTPEQAGTAVGKLSGGERGRLALARALALPSNVLVLDEPTNDLDLETLDLLQEMLADYPGTVILVSHDRDFLDRVATSVIVAEGNGRWTEYAGGYSDMVVQRGFGVTAPTAPTKPRGGRQVSLAPTTQPASKGKLSFKQKHALETLPKDMAKFEAEIVRLNAILSDGALYARDPAKFNATSKALADTQAALSKAEDAWLELEALREELEG